MDNAQVSQTISLKQSEACTYTCNSESRKKNQQQQQQHDDADDLPSIALVWRRVVVVVAHDVRQLVSFM